MLKAAQNILPTRMECSALQTESLHNLGLPAEKDNLMPGETTQGMHTEDCQPELLNLGTEVKYLYSDTLPKHVPEYTVKTVDTVEFMEVDNQAQGQSGGEQGVVDESESETDQAVGLRADSVETIEYDQANEESKIEENMKYVVNTEDHRADGEQTEDPTIQHPDVTTKDRDITENKVKDVAPVNVNFVEDSAVCVSTENLDRIDWDIIDENTRKVCDTQGNSEDVARNDDMATVSVVATYMENGDEKPADVDTIEGNIYSLATTNIDPILYLEENNQDVTRTNAFHLQGNGCSEQTEVIEEDIEIDVVDIENTITLEERQVDVVSTGEEVVVEESGVVIADDNKPLALPKHLFATQPDDSTDSVVDVVGVSDETGVSAINDRYLECPIPSPPSTIAYGESDSESLAVDDVQDPSTLQHKTDSLCKDPVNSNNIPGILSKEPQTDLTQSCSLQNTTNTNLSGNEHVDVEASFDVQSASLSLQSSLVLPELANTEATLNMPGQHQVHRPNVAHIPEVVHHSNTGEVPKTAGVEMLDQGLLHSNQVLSRNKVTGEAISMLQSFNNSSADILISGETGLTSDTSDALFAYNADSLYGLKQDQTQSILNTDNIVIDENEGAQVLMENPDGTRFLLNPDGTHIPVHTDEQGNNYMIDADGTAILLQTAEQQALTDSVTADEALISSQTGVGDPRLMESYLNTQITQTGIQENDHMDSVSVATGDVVNNGACVAKDVISDILTQTTTKVDSLKNIAVTTLGDSALQSDVNYAAAAICSGEKVQVQGTMNSATGVVNEVKNNIVTPATTSADMMDSGVVSIQGGTAAQDYLTCTSGGRNNIEGLSIGVSSAAQVQYITQIGSETYSVAGISGDTFIDGIVNTGTTSQAQFQHVVQDNVASTAKMSGDLTGIVQQDNVVTGAVQGQFGSILQPETESGSLSGQTTGMANGQMTYINADGSQIQYVYETTDEANAAAGNLSYGNHDNSGQVDFVAQSMRETGILPAPGSVSANVQTGATVISDHSCCLPKSTQGDTYYALIDGQYHKIDDPQVLASLGITLDTSASSAAASSSTAPATVTQQFPQPLAGSQGQNSNLVIQYPDNVQDQPINHNSTSQRQPSLLKTSIQELTTENTMKSTTKNSSLSGRGNSTPLSSQWESVKSGKSGHQYCTDLSSLYGVGSSNKYQSLRKQSKTLQVTETSSADNNKPIYYTIEGPKGVVTKYYMPAAQTQQDRTKSGNLVRHNSSGVNGLVKGSTYTIKHTGRKSTDGIGLRKQSPQKQDTGYTIISTQASEGMAQKSSSMSEGGKKTQQHGSLKNGLCTSRLSSGSTKYNITVKKPEKCMQETSSSSSQMSTSVLSTKSELKEKSPVIFSLEEFMNSAGSLLKEGKHSFVIKSKDSGQVDRPSTVIRLVSKEKKEGEAIENQFETENHIGLNCMEMTSAELMTQVKKSAANTQKGNLHSFQDMFTAKVAKEIAASLNSKEKQSSDILNTYLRKNKKKTPDPLSLEGYLKSNLKGPPPIKKESTKPKKKAEKVPVQVVDSSSVAHGLSEAQKKPTPPCITFSDFMCQVNMGAAFTPMTLIKGDGLGVTSIEVDHSEAKHYECGTRADVGVQATAEVILSQVQSGKSINVNISFKEELVSTKIPRKVESIVVSPTKYKEGEELFDMECESEGREMDQSTKKRKEKIIIPRVTPKKENDTSEFHRSTNNDPDWVVEARRKILLEEGKSLNADQNGNKIVEKVDIKTESNEQNSVQTENKEETTCETCVKTVDSSIETQPSIVKPVIDNIENSIKSVIKSNATVTAEVKQEEIKEDSQLSEKVPSSLLHSKSCDHRHEELTQTKSDPRTSRYEVGVDCKAKHSDGNMYDGIITQVDGSQARCYIDFLDKGCEWCVFDDVIPPQEPPCLEYIDEKMTCFNCRSGRDESTNQIVICDACGKGFHQLCHSPVIEDCVVHDFEMEWICCICRPITPEYVHVKPLPYNLSSLTWNGSHTENAEQIYCYCGSPGNWFLQMLQCRKCLQWFHQDCVSSLQESLLLGDQFYVFLCCVCNRGQEFLHRLHLRWVDIAHLAIFHLGLCLGKKYLDLKKEILPWVIKHWRRFKFAYQPLLDKKQKYLKLEEALSDMHYMNKFKNGKKAHKSETCWGLKVRSPPPSPIVKLPLMYPLTAVNTKHYRWKPMYKLSNIDCGIVTWNFAQAEALNRKRKLSENNGTENPNKRRKLDNKGTCAKHILSNRPHSLQSQDVPESSLPLLERKIPELSSYSGVNHPFLLDVERFQIKERNRDKVIATQRFDEVGLVFGGDINTANDTKSQSNKVENTDCGENESESETSRKCFNVLAKRSNSERLEYLIDWH